MVPCMVITSVIRINIRIRNLYIHTFFGQRELNPMHLTQKVNQTFNEVFNTEKSIRIMIGVEIT